MPAADALKVGSLCTGTGQLERALTLAGAQVDLAYVADPDQAASKVLAHHHPHTPNLGDLRNIDWTALPDVDVLATGFPCQPVSMAGRRAGTDDERWLFDDIADGIGRMGTRPRMLLLENVPGLLSANRGHAMARVVSRLASLGYVGRYRLVRASDVGAAHRRERVFIVAQLATDTQSIRHGHAGPPLLAGLPAATVASAATPGGLSLLPTPRASTKENRQTRRSPSQIAGTHGLSLATEVCSLLPTPRTSDANGTGSHGDGGMDLRTAVTLLPTPDATHGRKTTRTGPLLVGAVELLPTPRASDGTKGGPNQRGSSGDPMLPAAVQPDRWGRYAAAVACWEYVTGTPAPEPTEPGKNGPRLSPAFVEWLMGIPAGYVTDLVGRNDALRLLGNGVVAAQAAHAIRLLAAGA